jgi:hypothetical protein
MKKDKVISALESDESSVGNRARQRHAMLEGHSSVLATVQHESGHGELGQQVCDVDL